MIPSTGGEQELSLFSLLPFISEGGGGLQKSLNFAGL